MEVSALKQNAMPGLRGPSPLLRLQSDERLIALVRRGQHAAFETLVARYQSRLLAFCRHMLGSKEDAEDVLQEVFAAAFNAILADERAIHVRPWLYRIARNRSLNHLRRATAVGVDSMDVHFAEGGISTGEKVLKRESFRQLLSDVTDLPETQRTALLLREIDALSYEQIAEAMETTIPSVKSLLVRARISLAEAAEARKLSCAEVREQLGEAAERLCKLEAPARRHLRSCERCRAFRKQLKTNNVALAMTLPVGGLVMMKRLVASKLGASASAGHVASGAGAGAGAGAAAGTGAAAGGFATAGAGAIAGKAVAGLAAAALLTAGAVEAEHSSPAHHHAPAVAASAPRTHAAPTVVAATPQRASIVRVPPPRSRHAGSASAASKNGGRNAAIAKKASTKETSGAPASAEAPVSTRQSTAPAQEPTITEVVTETTQLPPATTSTQASQPPIAAGSGATTTVPSATPAPATTSPTTSTTTTTTGSEETATSSEETATSSEEPPEETQTTTTTTQTETETSSSTTVTAETGGSLPTGSTVTVVTTTP
jgi:RNA polymerase sigma factor (sigma-70 family)